MSKKPKVSARSALKEGLGDYYDNDNKNNPCSMVSNKITSQLVSQYKEYRNNVQQAFLVAWEEAYNKWSQNTPDEYQYYLPSNVIENIRTEFQEVVKNITFAEYLQMSPKKWEEEWEYPSYMNYDCLGAEVTLPPNQEEMLSIIQSDMREWLEMIIKSIVRNHVMDNIEYPYDEERTIARLREIYTTISDLLPETLDIPTPSQANKRNKRGQTPFSFLMADILIKMEVRHKWVKIKASLQDEYDDDELESALTELIEAGFIEYNAQKQTLKLLDN